MADLSRFLTAQNEGTPSTFDRALNELKNGRKRSHWIWFVLPQLRCLGRSATAIHFGIEDLEEARAYLADPVLRERLERVIAVLAEQLKHPDQSLRKLMGKSIDATIDQRSNQAEPDFVICAWRTNDAKHDMTPQELLQFCSAVIKHSPNWMVLSTADD